MTQSTASLARAVGPSLAALLISSSIAHLGADGLPHYMSDHSLFVTFWTGAAIMLVAFFLAFYSQSQATDEAQIKRKSIFVTRFACLVCGSISQTARPGLRG